jgi:hypothetical protein
MRSRLRWILVGIVPALCTATAQAEVTRPSTTRPAQIVSAGELYPGARRIVPTASRTSTVKSGAWTASNLCVFAASRIAGNVL